MKILALHLSNLFEYAAFQGIPEEVLRAHLIDPELDFCDQEATIQAEEFLGVLQEVIAHDSNPTFGLNFGCFLNLKALGLILDLSLNVSSIELAVLALQQYLESTFPLVCLSIEEDDTRYILKLESEVADQNLKRHLLDNVFTFMYRELKLMLKAEPEFMPLPVLPYNDTIAYTTALNTGILSGDSHSFILKQNVLKTEINSRRLKEIEVILPKFLLMLKQKMEGYQPFALQVRKMTLNLCSPEPPDFDLVARQFPLSHRTIQRRLTNEGISFRKIVDDIKRELSFYLSKGKKIKTQDIALILGYSEPSAYLHAVKRWKN